MLREAQRQSVLADGHAGLAVTVDIGDRYNLHPSNKIEVGNRLARLARHLVYGETLAPSGPVPFAARRSGKVIAISFKDIEGRLVSYDSEAPIGFELCGPAPTSCHYVRATIKTSRSCLIRRGKSTQRVYAIVGPTVLCVRSMTIMACRPGLLKCRLGSVVHDSYRCCS